MEGGGLHSWCGGERTWKVISTRGSLIKGKASVGTRPTSRPSGSQKRDKRSARTECAWAGHWTASAGMSSAATNAHPAGSPLVQQFLQDAVQAYRRGDKDEWPRFSHLLVMAASVELLEALPKATPLDREHLLKTGTTRVSSISFHLCLQQKKRLKPNEHCGRRCDAKKINTRQSSIACTTESRTATTSCRVEGSGSPKSS